jgi:alkane 1-monooxygenase
MAAVVPYYLALLFPLATFLGTLAGGWGLYATPLLALVLHPLLDLNLIDRFKTDYDGPRWIASLPLYLFAAAQLLLLFWALLYVSSSPFEDGIPLQLMVSVGLSAAWGLAVAHELVHRKHRRERAAGVALLASVHYSHYRIEHVYGHHRNVATPEDPTSARFGESLYQFWLRCLPTSYWSAWTIEWRNRGLSPDNRMIQYALLEVLLLFLVNRFLGVRALLFFLGQGLIAVLMLEAINYIEHYGLERQMRPWKEYETITALHSWDCPRALSAWTLFNVTRHAHHHRSPLVRYEDLEIAKDAPRLPAGYTLMLLIALLPPLWFSIMNPRVPEPAESPIPDRSRA